MRITTAVHAPVLLAILVGAVACGGTKVKPTGPTTAPPGAERPPGTTGLPGLDWTSNAGEILALYPGAEPNGGGIGYTGTALGRPARIQFEVDGEGLRQIDIAWDGTFDSMGACGEVLHQLRPAIDARLGQGAEENLGVFWDTATASVTLACNPDDDGEHATLSQTYAQKVAE